MDSAPPDRQIALQALTDALVQLVEACERMQLVSVWVLEAYAAGDDHEIAETVRMLPVGTPRPSKPAVPPPAPVDEPVAVNLYQPDSVTGDESAEVDR